MPNRLAIVASTIALAFVPAALVACGSDDGSDSANEDDRRRPRQGEQLESGVTLTLWTMPNSPKPKEDLQKMVEPFTAKTGVKVDVQEVGWDVQFDRIRNAAVSGEGPDITQAGTTQVPFFAALGGFTDLSDRVEEIGGKGAYAEGIWNTTQVSGQEGTWAVPWFTEARSIYYRKDVLEKAGVDPATAFADLDSFKATLQAIKDKVPDIEPFGAPGKKAYDLVHNVMPFVWDNGGAELSADAKKSTINSPESQEGVEFMGDLITAGLFDKSQLERDGTQVENQFKGGRLAVWIGGPWVLGSIDRAEDDTWSDEARENVGVAPMPTGPGGKAYTFVGGSDLMVFKSTEHPNEAWALVEVPLRGSDPEGLRGPARHVPGAPGAAAAGGRVLREPQGVLRGHPERADVRADPAVGPDRERVQDALREHPRQRGRRRQGLQRGDREVPARRRGEGGRRALGPVGGVVAPTTLQPPPEASSARVLPSRAGRPRRRRTNWFAYGLIAPAVTFMVLMHLLPTRAESSSPSSGSTPSPSPGSSALHGTASRTTRGSCSTPPTRCTTGSSAPS